MSNILKLNFVTVNILSMFQLLSFYLLWNILKQSSDMI